MNKKVQLILPFVFVSLTLILISCLKEKTSPITGGACTTNVSYDTIIRPIIELNCSTSGCHDASGSGGYTFTSYAAVAASADIILKVIRHENGVSAMPQGSAKLADSVAINFDCWIQQGKLNN